MSAAATMGVLLPVILAQGKPAYGTPAHAVSTPPEKAE